MLAIVDRVVPERPAARAVVVEAVLVAAEVGRLVLALAALGLLQIRIDLNLDHTQQHVIRIIYRQNRVIRRAICGFLRSSRTWDWDRPAPGWP